MTARTEVDYFNLTLFSALMELVMNCRRLPPSGSEEMITRLLFSGMFVEFVKVESPSALAEFGRALGTDHFW